MEKELKVIIKELKAIRKELEKQNKVINDVAVTEFEPTDSDDDLFRGFNIR